MGRARLADPTAQGALVTTQAERWGTAVARFHVVIEMSALLRGRSSASSDRGNLE